MLLTIAVLAVDMFVSRTKTGHADGSSVANYLLDEGRVDGTLREIIQLKTVDSEGGKSLQVWIRADRKGDGVATSAKLRELAKPDSCHESDEGAQQELASSGKSTPTPEAVSTKTRETAEEVEARDNRGQGTDKPPVTAGGTDHTDLGEASEPLKISEEDLHLKKQQMEANRSIYRGLAHALIRNNRYDEALSYLPQREHSSDNLDTLLLMAECEHYLGKVAEAEKTMTCFDNGVQRCSTPQHQLLEWGDEVSNRGRHLASLIIYRSVYYAYSSKKLEDNVALYYIVVAKMFCGALEMVEAGGQSRHIVSKLVITWMIQITFQLEEVECVDTDRRTIAVARCLGFVALLHHKTDCFGRAIRCGREAVRELMHLVNSPNYRPNSTAGDIFFTLSLACRSKGLHLSSETYRKLAIDEYERATDFEDDSCRQRCLESLRSGLRQRDVIH